MRRSPLLVLALAMLLAALGPVVTSAQTPTPVGDSPLMSLLHRLPNNLPSDGWIHYANYELQLETMGIDAPGSDLSPEEWVAATHGAMVPYTFTIPTAPEWREGLGFDMRDVDAFAELRSGDMSISVFAGDFDADALSTVWEAAGYAPVDGNVTWYTLGDDHALIFDHPMHSMHLGSLSHLVVLDDGTVAGTATRADMEAVIALSAGDESSFADGRGAVFQDAPDDLVGGYIYDGSTLIATVDPLSLMPNNPNVPEDAQERLATQVALMEEEAPRMPPIHTALIGVSAGAVDQEQAADGLSRARSILVVVPLNEGATAEVAETVTRRLTTLPVPLILDVGDQPYSALFTDMVIETPTESPVVVVDLVPADDVPATVLITLLNARQLTVLSWIP